MKHTALVTGGSRGLGRAIALQLAKDGADVAVNYRSDRIAAEEVCTQIRQLGCKALPVQADVTDERDVDRMTEEAVGVLGPIQVLVVNATGPQPFDAIEDQTWDIFLEQLNFFVKSPLLLLKAVLPAMKERRYGRVIQIGSEVLEAGVPRFASYVAAKGAQLGATRSWARELAPFNITVNLVAPGWIPTDRHADATQDERDEYIRAVPLGRMGEPDDVGRMVAFLAGEGGNFITGQKVSVNGGHTLL